jgi:hypothetical protein
MLVGDAEVGAADQRPEADEQDRPRDRGDREPAVELGAAATPPHDRGDQPQRGEQVGERQPEREAERELPRGDRKRRQHEPRTPQAVATHPEREREWDPAARDHVHVPVLLEAEGREGESRPGDDRSRGPDPQLARQQVCAEEGQRVGEQEQHVVARHGGLAPRPDQPGRRVAEQGVGECKRVVERPELVGLEELERLMGERVAAPRHLPRLHQRVAEVLGDVLSQMQHQRPVHDHGEQAGAEREQQKLAGRDLAPDVGHPRRDPFSRGRCRYACSARPSAQGSMVEPGSPAGTAP